MNHETKIVNALVWHVKYIMCSYLLVVNLVRPAKFLSKVLTCLIITVVGHVQIIFFVDKCIFNTLNESV